MENETRSMVGLLYVLKDETCRQCNGSGEIRLRNDHSGDSQDDVFRFDCSACEGKGSRTFKVELSEAISILKKGKRDES